MNFMRKLFKRRNDSVAIKEQNILLLMAHQHFMSLPHSFFLRKGPK